MIIHPAYLFALIGIAFGLFRVLEDGWEALSAAVILPAGAVISTIFR